MVTKTDYHSIMELKEKYTPKQRGFVSKEEAEIIRSVLEIPERNDIELQNIRDMVVILYGQWAEHMREVERRDNDTAAGDMFSMFMDAMSAITHIVDVEKVRRGLEV